jgi:hypothetical protein
MVSALHSSTPCSTNPQPLALPAPSSSCATDLCSPSSNTTPPAPALPMPVPTAPLSAAKLDAFLAAASCEAQMVQIMLGSYGASDSAGGTAGGTEAGGAAASSAALHQLREQHLLDAVVSRGPKGCRACAGFSSLHLVMSMCTSAVFFHSAKPCAPGCSAHLLSAVTHSV